MFGLRLIEIFLIEMVIYMALWVWDDYIATLISMVFCSICFFILLIALIAELLERSKVPRAYFYFMSLSILAPILAAAIYIGIYGSDFAWMSQ